VKQLPKTTAIEPAERIEQVILLIRGQRVIPAADLAGLYAVPTKRLNEQVRRLAMPAQADDRGVRQQQRHAVCPDQGMGRPEKAGD
jgi:hypothetical protein